MYPLYKEIQEPLLREIIRRGGEARPSSRDETGRTIYQVLADYFGLTQDERERKLTCEGHTRVCKWNNMVLWARRHLKDAGQLKSVSHGIWAAVREPSKNDSPERAKHDRWLTILDWTPELYREFFTSPFIKNAPHVGKPFTVVHRLPDFEPGDGNDNYLVKFDDGTELVACGHEVCRLNYSKCGA